MNRDTTQANLGEIDLDQQGAPKMQDVELSGQGVSEIDQGATPWIEYELSGQGVSEIE